MARSGRSPATMCESTNLADLIERVLDKGLVISGDIRIKLVDVELLTIQIRLVVCSVERAEQIGLDWWNHPESSRWLPSRAPAPVEGASRAPGSMARPEARP